MALEGLRARLRSFADNSREAADRAREEAPRRVRGAARAAPEGARRARQAGRQAVEGAERVAPQTGLEGRRKPKPPQSAREAIARRLNHSGQMHKPIDDATLDPAADPRFVEALARGDAATSQEFFGGTGGGDPYTTYFARGDDAGFTFGAFVEEELDERDHEGGHYAFDDEREEGWIDDGIPPTQIMGWPP